MDGTITNVTVTLSGLSHTWLSDVDVLLVGPAGQMVLIFSDVGDGFDSTIAPVTVTLSDAAASALPAGGPFASGTYKPTDYSTGGIGDDTFPSPAPEGPYATTYLALQRDESQRDLVAVCGR